MPVVQRRAAGEEIDVVAAIGISEDTSLRLGEDDRKAPAIAANDGFPALEDFGS